MKREIISVSLAAVFTLLCRLGAGWSRHSLVFRAPDHPFTLNLMLEEASA